MIIYKGPKGRRSLEKGSKHNIQLRNVIIEHRDVRGSGGEDGEGKDTAR